MASPCLLFENIFEDGTITSSSEASGYVDDNVKYWRTDTPYRWKASSVTPPAWVKVDLGGAATASPTAVAFAGHNLFTAGARYRVQSSPDDAAWTDVLAATAAADNLPVIAKWAAPTARRYWRFYIDTAAGNFATAPAVGVVTLGRYMELPSGGVQEDLDPYGEEAVTEWTQNDGGSFLGANLRYVRKGLRIAIPAPGFTKTAFFAPASGLKFDTDFLAHYRANPFWFAWNTDEDSRGVYLCRTARVSMPFVGSTSRRALYMDLDAKKEIA